MSYLPAVNEKRVYAQLLCQQATTADLKHLKVALLQGAVLHLHCAFLFYLSEVADNYQCARSDVIGDTGTLLARLAEKGKSPAEAEELHNLNLTSGSWLDQLKACERQISSPSMPLKQIVQDDLIMASGQGNVGQVELDCVVLERWIQELTDMVERHRETMVEC